MTGRGGDLASQSGAAAWAGKPSIIKREDKSAGVVRGMNFS
jgi:hypothetical protein